MSFEFIDFAVVWASYTFLKHKHLLEINILKIQVGI